MNNKKIIWAKIRTSFEGIHCYPGAPKEVQFLRCPHRHIFHVVVLIEQFHNDRDIEFIAFKHFLNTILKSNKFHKNASCEMMSDNLFKIINKKYPNRKIKIEINEDNENGTLIEYE